MSAKGLRFQWRSDFVNFASMYPGGLLALFLLLERHLLHTGPPVSIADLEKLGPSVWAKTLSGQEEVMDQRDVLCLAKILLGLSRYRWPQSVDIISMRTKEI